MGGSFSFAGYSPPAVQAWRQVVSGLRHTHQIPTMRLDEIALGLSADGKGDGEEERTELRGTLMPREGTNKED